MTTLVETLCSCLDRRNEHREALAEAVLFKELQSSAKRKRFARIIGLHKNSHIASCDTQEVSESGDARHDLVLRTKTGRKIFVELKGFAGFTKWQLKALRGKSKNSGQIDVLIVPEVRKSAVEELVDDAVKVVTWEQVDSDVIRSPLGRLASLWHGNTVRRWSELRAAARNYIKYYRDGESTGSYWALWDSLGSLSRLMPTFEFGRTAGPRPGIHWSYYGRRIYTPKGRRYWIGWVFEGGAKGRFKLALVLAEQKDLCPPKLRNALPAWIWPDSHGEVLALCSGNEAELDLEEIARRLHKYLR